MFAQLATVQIVLSARRLGKLRTLTAKVERYPLFRSKPAVVAIRPGRRTEVLCRGHPTVKPDGVPHSPIAAVKSTYVTSCP